MIKIGCLLYGIVLSNTFNVHELVPQLDIFMI